MIRIPIQIVIEVGILCLNIFGAVLNRGTWIGWLFTALVIWQVVNTIIAIRNIYND